MQHKSEIIYLKEPHILKKNLNFHPGSARHDDKLFLTLQQLSVEFITELVTSQAWTAVKNHSIGLPRKENPKILSKRSYTFVIN